MLDWKSLEQKEKNAVLERPAPLNSAELTAQVTSILNAVRDEGDSALLSLTEKYDQVSVKDLQISESEVQKAVEGLSPGIKAAIDSAYQNIFTFHSAQTQQDITIETSPGVVCSLRSRPVESVGLYVPGGETPLVSTALMLGVPAQISGCPRKVLLSPPNKQGAIAPEIIYAAKRCGIEEMYKVGGAQAIAAMAYGTKSIAAVDKIYGPGNRYVTEAKIQLSKIQGLVGIDMPAGPSEVLVIADKTAKAKYVAADLLAQAEHGPDSQVILISDDQNLIRDVELEIEIQIKTLERQDIAREALRYSRLILVESIEEALQLSNTYAPEHLILNIEQADEMVDGITNAGSIFLGSWTPESAGDYASGTNHVLPTYGAARYTSSLSLKDFQIITTIQKISAPGLANLGQTIMTLANAEGLTAHSRAVSIRLEDVQS